MGPRTRSPIKSSVTKCPQPGCNGDSQIEDTLKHDTFYVKRSRACKKCGITWSTAELPLRLAKKLMKLDKFLEQLNAQAD